MKGRFAMGGMLLGLAAGAVPSLAPAQRLDGSAPMLCAIVNVVECDDRGQCERMTPDEVGIGTFVKVDVGQRMITGASATPRRTEIKMSSRLDGRLVLSGGENGRGWSVVVAEESGQMSAAVVDQDHTFVLSGACTRQ